MRTLAMSTLLFVAALPAYAGSDGHPAVQIPKRFEAMKPLLGTWEGRNKMGNEEHDMTVVYELTSGGTAITERLMAGTPQEMVSVYHKDGNSVAMTHYCAMGNQPRMKLKSADAKAMAFEMAGTTGVASLKEPHMHGVKLTLVDANTLRHDWAYYRDGAQKETVTFLLKRKQ